MIISGTKKEIADKLLQLPDGKYKADVTPMFQTRTREQNNRLWKLIRKIEEETGNSTDEVYIGLLTQADIKSVITTDPNGEWRYVERIGKTPTGEIQYKCYAGSSEFDSREMMMLRDTAQLQAAEIGVDDGCY